MTATIEATTTKRPMPGWINQYAESFRANEAHGFILHGDVEGIAHEGVSNRALLLSVLASRRDVIAVYSLAGGVAIWQEDEPIVVDGRATTRGARARELVGAGQQAPEQPNALSQLLGQQGGAGGAQADPFAAATSPTAALALLARLLRAGKRVAVIVEHADALVPVPQTSGMGAMSPEDRRVLVALLDLARDRVVGALGNPVFLVTRELGNLHTEIRAADSGWRALNLRLPNRDERAEYIGWYLARRETKGKPIALGDGLAVAELANNTAGLSLRNIEDVLLVSAQQGGVTRALVKEYKDRVVKTQYSEIARMIDPLPGGFAQLGGLAELKAWAYSDLIEPVREGRKGDVPKGVLLVGPPGTGKTYFVRALAREVAFNAVQLEMSAILGGIVGESEAKFDRFIALVKSLRPCMVFLDELDQTDVSKRGGSSGNPVASNLFNKMLTTVGDETLRGEVIFMFGSNRPDLLDSALTRFGRMDAIIPLLLPEPADRCEIVAVQAQEQGVAIGQACMPVIEAGTDLWSAADLGALVRKVRKYAKGEPATPEHCARALVALRPNSAQMAGYYTDLAVNACNDRDLLPARYAELLDDRGALAARAKGATAALAGAEREEREW